MTRLPMDPVTIDAVLLKVRAEGDVLPHISQQEAVITAVNRAVRSLASEQQATAAVFVTGDHKTCPACESLILADGTCVNCRAKAPGEQQGAAPAPFRRLTEEHGATVFTDGKPVDTGGMHNFADCIKADGDKPCRDCVEYANESVGAPPAPMGTPLGCGEFAVDCPRGHAAAGDACGRVGNDRFVCVPRLDAARAYFADTRATGVGSKKP